MAETLNDFLAQETALAEVSKEPCAVTRMTLRGVSIPQLPLATRQVRTPYY
jgi:hypothetical protein